jgi:ATP-dependent Clp endopeptidase proteolytic subunit ClpP
LAERDEWRPEDRYLYLNGEISDEQTREITARLVENWDREFLLIINSDGGSSFNALGLVNLMRQHGRVDTLCLGVALSGAADCLAAGRKRYIVPGTVAMLHQVSWELGREFANNLVKNAQFLERLNGEMADQLVQFTGRTREQLDRDMATDFYLFGQEIIDYGLADALCSPAELFASSPAPALKGRLRAGAHERRKSLAPREEEGPGRR